MGTYLVTWKWLWLGQECRNTFYYETTAGEPTNSEWQDICDEIRGDIDTELKARLSADIAWYGIDRRKVDTAGLLTFSEVPTAGSVVGTAGTDDVATQVAILVSNKGVTTKPNRARSYLPGGTQSSMVNSLWTSDVRDDAETLIDLQSDLNSIGTNPLQRVAAEWNSSHTQVVNSNDISGATSVASQVPATQRRRRIGRGI